MSQENVEIARATVEAANEGIEALLRFVRSDAVWYPFPEWPDDSEYRGHDGVRKVMASWFDNFDEHAVSVDQIRDLGDRVLLLGEQTARIKGSGVPIRQPIGWVCSGFQDGQIGDIHLFLSWRQALEAARLSE
jgi:ketosteroid isomerase-like protein